MRFKDVFAIIGPSMVGPSSSHTAGAVRIGRVARQIFDSMPQSVEVVFYGSFADTYQGHGTDMAIVAGLLNWDTDDERIPESLQTAESLGMEVQFRVGHGQAQHPNTARLILTAEDQKLSVIGKSIGGGNIEIIQVEEFDVRFTGSYPTFLINHSDRKGMLAEITRLLSDWDLNIGYMNVDRKSRNGEALTVIEVDSAIVPAVVQALEKLPSVQAVRTVDLMIGRLEP